MRYYFIFIFFILFLVTVFVYQDLLQTFYQQDEWQGLGHVMEEGMRYVTANFSLLQIVFGEGRVFTRTLGIVFLGLFPFNILPLAVFSILLHFVNTSLVFLLTKIVSGKNLLALLASIFFAVNSVSHQAVSWFGTSIGTLPATMFVLLAIIFYFVYCKNGKKKFLYLTFFFTIVSLWFKEIALFLFLFLPLLYLIFKKGNIFQTVKVHLLLFAYGLGLVAFRLFELFSQKEKVGVFVGGNDGFFQTIILHLVLYPITSLSQVFIPPLTLSSWASEITKIQYPFFVDNPIIGLVSQTITADLLSIFLSAVLLLTLFSLFTKSKDFKIVLFAVILILTSFLPYIVLDRSFSYLESRYYYIASIGAGMILALVIRWFIQKAAILGVIALFLSFVFLFYHAILVRAEIERQVILANERKMILSQIKESYPKLESKSTFYLTGNKTFYVENLPLPFQQGIGYTLMVWYNDIGVIPKELLLDNFLWGMTDEGYQEVDKAGFGYFWDFEKLERMIRENKLASENVYAFFYDGQMKELKDITADTRAKLSKDDKWLK